MAHWVEPSRLLEPTQDFDARDGTVKTRSTFTRTSPRPGGASALKRVREVNDSAVAHEAAGRAAIGDRNHTNAGSWTVEFPRMKRNADPGEYQTDHWSHGGQLTL